MTAYPTISSVSVIIPARNEASNIARCIESVRSAAARSTEIDVEVIVVDNGSADDTREIAVSLGAAVLMKPKVTISELRNIGASVASGELLAFLDADVFVEEEWLKNALLVLQQPEVVCAGCSPAIPAESTWVQRAWHADVEAAPFCSTRDWLASMNMFVKKEVFQKAGGFDTALHTCEDVDFGYRVRKYGTVLFDKSIRAVHVGEAKGMMHFFRKESWRGIANFDGMVRHGLVKEEIPSHLIAFAYFAFYPAVVASIVLARYKILLGMLLASLLLPLARVLRIPGVLAAPVKLAQVYVIWLLYCWARGYSGFRWIFLKLAGNAAR